MALVKTTASDALIWIQDLDPSEMRERENVEFRVCLGARGFRVVAEATMAAIKVDLRGFSLWSIPVLEGRGYTLCELRSSADAATAHPALMGSLGMAPEAGCEYLKVRLVNSINLATIDWVELPFPTSYIIDINCLKKLPRRSLKSIPVSKQYPQTHSHSLDPYRLFLEIIVVICCLSGAQWYHPDWIRNANTPNNNQYPLLPHR